MQTPSAAHAPQGSSRRVAFWWFLAASVVFAWSWCGVASASTDFTWSGASSSDSNWSDAANWAGGAAPQPDSTIGTLTFPDVGCSCGSTNDVSGLAVQHFVFGDGDGYSWSGDQISLGGGGLTDSDPGGLEGQAHQTLSIPIALVASQTWTYNGYGLNVYGGLSGSSSALTLNLAGPLDLGGDNEVGNTVISGGGGVQLVAGSLNASDGNTVQLDNSSLTARDFTATGPLTVSNSAVSLDGPATVDGTVLTVPSATFDSASTLTMENGYDGTGELQSAGNVDLGGATLAITGCVDPQGSSAVTLVSAETLIGQFGNVPNGGTITVGSPPSSGCTYQITYNETGSPQTVTATLLVPSNTSLPVISGSAVVGQMLSCSTGAWSFEPTGYTYQWTRDGADIEAATSATYIVQVADAGHQLACVVTANGAAGSASAASAPVVVAALGPGSLSDPVGLTFSGSTDQPTGAFVATFQDSDPSAVPSDYVASIDWGDGQTSPGVVDASYAGGFVVTGEHTYVVPVAFPTRVTITKQTRGSTPAQVIATGDGDISGPWAGFCPSNFTYASGFDAPFDVSLYTYPDHVADFSIGPVEIKVELSFDLPDIGTCSRGATSTGATAPPSGKSSATIAEPINAQRPPPLSAGRPTLGFSYGITSHRWLSTNQQPWTIYSPTNQGFTATFNPQAEAGPGINLTPFGDSLVALRIAKFTGVTLNTQLVNVAATGEFFGTLLTPSASIELSFRGTDLRDLLEQVAVQNPDLAISLASAIAAGMAAAATVWSEIPSHLPIELPPSNVIEINFGGTPIEVPSEFPDEVFNPKILEFDFQQGIDEVAAQLSPDLALVGDELVDTAAQGAGDDVVVGVLETVVGDSVFGVGHRDNCQDCQAVWPHSR